MKITVTTGESKWSDFETKAWAKADTEHYGEPLDWVKKEFIITAKDENGKQIGASRMNIEVGVCFIETIIVDDSRRGMGIGKQLLQKAEQVATDNGAHKIYLKTGKAWEAVVFYEKQGYVVTAQLPNHYFHTDFVEMTKFLT